MLRTLDFDYDLPEDRVAQAPLARRDASRFLVATRASSFGVVLSDHVFGELGSVLAHRYGILTGRGPSPSNPALIDPKLPASNRAPLIILNESKVFAARIPVVRKHSEGEGLGVGEVFLLEFDPLVANEPGQLVKALLRPQKKMKPGDILSATGDATQQELFQVVDIGEQNCQVRTLVPLFEILESFGKMPLPPYIRRGKAAADAPDEWSVFDRERYQTVYAGTLGSAAAPTAGLHLTRELMDELEDQGLATFAKITLHVGLGTFRPVQVEQVSDHKMHAERYSISLETVERILAAVQQQRPIVYLGTTSFRATEAFFLDAAMQLDGSEHRNSSSLPLDPKLVDLLRDAAGAERTTQLFIYPGCDERWGLNYAPVVGDALITNFHQPKSTLLMLVAALVGMEQMHMVYGHALANNYRFLSYGDASLLPFALPQRLTWGKP